MPIITDKIKKIKSDPFPYFYGDNIFPDSLVDKLCTSWPDKEHFESNVVHGGKISFQRSDNGMDGFLEKSPEWSRLIKSFNSQEFLDEIRVFAFPLMIRKRPFLFLRKWTLFDKNKNSLLAHIIKKQIEIDWEFSVHRTSSYLSPHTDRSTKIVSLIFYFPCKEWKSEYGGSTSIFTPKNKRHEKNWFNYYVPFEFVNLKEAISYKKNRIVGFFKTGNSYHGAKGTKYFHGIERRAFIININIPEEFQSKIFYRIIESIHRRFEYPNFKEFSNFYKERAKK